MHPLIIKSLIPVGVFVIGKTVCYIIDEDFNDCMKEYESFISLLS